MAEAEESQDAPLVFVSYSHDSKEHKEWVAKLVIALRDKGIEVLIDQFDLGPGDDVPRFMADCVQRAGRVLMVCTDAYVRKANDGVGGVGYEAMIVTAELVKNLGTNRFIPIVRQPGKGPKVTPTFLGVRKYINLTTDEDWKENLDELVEDIHQVRHLRKGPLGPSPFAGKTYEGEKIRKDRQERRSQFGAALTSPVEAYHTAGDLIHDRDRVRWRKLLLAASDHAASQLKGWMQRGMASIPQFDEEAPQPVFDDLRHGMAGYEPLLACLLAAAESGQPDYANQLGWIETIYSPPYLSDVGATYFVRFPEALLYVANALVGGMLMQSGAGEAAYRLATSKLEPKFGQEPAPIYASSGVTGWPDPIGHRCTSAWQFLDQTIGEWAWLKEAFGSPDACRSAVTGYYMLMSFLNFVELAKAGQLTDEAVELRKQWRGGFPLSVPISYLTWPKNVVAAGYGMLIDQRPLLEKVLSGNGLTRPQAAALWPKWLELCTSWMWSVYRHTWFQSASIPTKLFDDWESDPYRLP